MYYNKVLPVCQLLFAGVVFKQQAAQQANSPGCSPFDSMHTVYCTNKGAVPQHEHGPAHYEADQDKAANNHHRGSNGCNELVHYLPALAS